MCSLSEIFNQLCAGLHVQVSLPQDLHNKPFSKPRLNMGNTTTQFLYLPHLKPQATYILSLWCDNVLLLQHILLWSRGRVPWYTQSGPRNHWPLRRNCDTRKNTPKTKKPLHYRSGFQLSVVLWPVNQQRVLRQLVPSLSHRFSTYLII